MDAARDSGVAARCSHPRSLGLICTSWPENHSLGVSDAIFIRSPYQPVNISYESVGYYAVTYCDSRLLALREYLCFPVTHDAIPLTI